MAILLLVRHGETDWNLERRWQGQADRPLNETGRSQARELAERLASGKRPAAVFSSDLARARETAEIVAGRLELLPVQLDARLREVDVGEWSGLTLAEVEERYPEGLRRRLSGGTGWERGETYEQMGERVLAALAEIAAGVGDARALVVTHGGATRAVWLAGGGSAADRPDVGNCDVHPVRVWDGTISWLD